VYGDGDVFSHSINTYEGCSGAVVFLLDKDQPAESVQEEDFGKAIGVHAAGYSPHNLGMTVFKAFHSMTNPALNALA
jgi:V8-like Glu-specific endopeptidase